MSCCICAGSCCHTGPHMYCMEHAPKPYREIIGYSICPTRVKYRLIGDELFLINERDFPPGVLSLTEEKG